MTKRTKGNCRVCRDSPRLITSWVDLPCPADSRRFRAPHIAGPGRTRRFQAVPIGLVTDTMLLGWTTECLLCATRWNSSVGESARAACGTTSPADLRAQVPHNARASSRSRVPPSAGTAGTFRTPSTWGMPCPAVDWPSPSFIVRSLSDSLRSTQAPSVLGIKGRNCGGGISEEREHHVRNRHPPNS